MNAVPRMAITFTENVACGKSTAGFAFGAVAGLLALRSFRKFPWRTLAPAREDVRALLSLVARRGSLQPHDEVEPS